MLVSVPIGISEGQNEPSQVKSKNEQQFKPNKARVALESQCRLAILQSPRLEPKP